MINFKNIALRRGANVLLQDVNWTIYHKQHIGLIGANGSGKSSLFSMVLGEISPDAGDLEIPKKLKLSHVAQETPSLQISAIDYVLDGDTVLRDVEKRLKEAEISNDSNEIANCHVRLSEIDGYSASSRAAQLLDGLGFSHHDQQQMVSDFSGGWRVRLNLAKALMTPSDFLLLDEPTNHLDLDAVIWLQSWLKQYKGTLLLISHDREFLDETVDHIAHIYNQELKVYVGNYSSFEKQRAQQILLQQSAYDKQQKYITHLQGFINRFKAKASKAKQAQSRVKALEKMELINAVKIEHEFQFAFKTPSKCPNPLLTIEDGSVSYGTKRVLEHIHLSITPKDRIGLLGLNGAGKSSLIKLIAGEIPPTQGLITTGSGLKIGYFAQHQVDHLELDESPLSYFKNNFPNISEQSLRTYLGTFDFRGDDVSQKIRCFSGGEKSRLALAHIVFQQPNLLLLDEPTNHLDLDMRNSLSSALQEYEGAMIIVSHDRFLLRTTVDQFLLVDNHRVNVFDGDLDEYEKWLLQARKNIKKSYSLENPSSPSKKEQRKEETKQREDIRPVVSKIKQLETQLKSLEAKLDKIDLLLTDSTIYAEINKNRLKEVLLKQADLKKEILNCENEWLLLSEKLN